MDDAENCRAVFVRERFIELVVFLRCADVTKQACHLIIDRDTVVGDVARECLHVLGTDTFGIQRPLDAGYPV